MRETYLSTTTGLKLLFWSSPSQSTIEKWCTELKVSQGDYSEKSTKLFGRSYIEIARDSWDPKDSKRQCLAWIFPRESCFQDAVARTG